MYAQAARANRRVFTTVNRYETPILLTIVNMFKSVHFQNQKCDCIKYLKLGDPACGSGVFSIESLKHVWKEVSKECSDLGWPDKEIFAEQQEVAIKNFRGIDKEAFLSKPTKAYMAILGDGRGGVFCENSLEPVKNWSAKA